MNKKALTELTDKCIECIYGWKKDNWYEPLDIELGGFIEHCRIYGDDDIQYIYEEVWDGAPEDDPEVQSALWKLERQLFMINIDNYMLAPDDCLTEEQKECIYIGKRIAMLRAERGMTQKELADKVGIKREHVCRIEAGKYSVGLKILSKIAKALDMELEFIKNV